MDHRPWAERHPTALARTAGLAGISVVAATFLPGNLGGPLFDPNLSTPRLLAWVKGNVDGISLSAFTDALVMTLLGLFLLALISIVHGRGLLARVATASVAVMLGVDWVDAGVTFALSDAARRQSADAGVVALFSLEKTMTFADGFALGLAVIAVSLTALAYRKLSPPLVWLGLLAGAFHLVGLPVQLALNSRPDGVTGPISVAVGMVWLLALSIVLLLRPPATGTAGRTGSDIGIDDGHAGLEPLSTQQRSQG